MPSSYRRPRTIELEVSLADFDDDEIVDEIKGRKLESKVFNGEGPGNLMRLVGDVQAYLCARRYGRAQEAMQTLLAAVMPPEIAAAAEAMRENRIQDAICELDDYLEPSPAATATELPVKKEPAPAC
jgi:hypothetical protein